MINAYVLRFYDPKKQLVLSVDAGSKGLGSVKCVTLGRATSSEATSSIRVTCSGKISAIPYATRSHLGVGSSINTFTEEK